MTPADRDAVLRHVPAFGVETGVVLQRLSTYESLLLKWQAAQNLVSRETLPHLWVRHFADSLQALPLLRDTDRLILDLGSGAGFPALPLAMASGPVRRFVLLEPNRRKVSFLRAVIRETGVNAVVYDTRIEQFDSRETFDVVTSRAMAPLADLLGLAEDVLRQPARGLFHKGREHLSEIAQAADIFAFDVLLTQSELDSGSVIVEVSNLSRRG